MQVVLNVFTALFEKCNPISKQLPFQFYNAYKALTDLQADLEKYSSADKYEKTNNKLAIKFAIKKNFAKEFTKKKDES